MLTTEITKRIDAHYQSSDVPLLLSSLGKALRVEGLWPISNETRTLREVIQSLSGYLVVRDEQSPAYAVVVPEGKKSIADEAIKSRQESTFLNNLPKSVVHAFVKHLSDGEKIYLPKVPPFKYLVSSEEVSAEFVEIEDRFRLKDIGYVESLRDLDKSLRDNLSENIRKWAAKSDIPLERFYRIDLLRREAQAESHPVVRAQFRSTSQLRRSNALERLLAAQNDDYKDRLVVPIDIALTLSRLP